MQPISDTSILSSELRALFETAITLRLSENQINTCVNDVCRRPFCKRALSKIAASVFNSLVLVSTVYVLTRFLCQLSFIESIISQMYDDYTYAALRTSRLLTMPLLAQFPSLAQYHTTKCLLKNPFFTPINANDCWPCDGLKAVVDLSGHVHAARDYILSGTPFVVRDAVHSELSLEYVQKTLRAHGVILSDQTSKYESTLDKVKSVEEFINQRDLLKTKVYHIFWRTNSVSSARILRKTFPRPYFVPKTTEVSLERSFLTDGPEEPNYTLPQSDFANTLLVQVEGTRIIVLEPSDYCSSNCLSVSILMKPKDMLYYNNQISKPRSVPSLLTDSPSVVYMSSFY
ncbi:uncharacterized protein LOC135393767 [Ornithodoros turicata]|uniref:uncharacterized protein LOC135393767 n=1 Tax=Ornithodoros turicata TaxID=34597 RepID=UPI003138C47F